MARSLESSFQFRSLKMVIRAKLYRWTAPCLGTTQRAPKRSSFSVSTARWQGTPRSQMTVSSVMAQRRGHGYHQRLSKRRSLNGTDLSTILRKLRHIFRSAFQRRARRQQESKKVWSASARLEVTRSSFPMATGCGTLSSPHLTPLRHTFARNFEFPLADNLRERAKRVARHFASKAIAICRLKKRAARFHSGTRMQRTSKQRALRTHLCRRSMTTQLRSKAFRQPWCQWQISAVVPLTLILSQACRS